VQRETVKLDETANNLEERQHTWRVALAFWLSLLFSAVLYAAVVLSPKLLDYVALENEFQTNRAELVSLEQRVLHLERVSEALKNDPEFAAELARIDFEASRPGDERIAVEPLLSLEAVPATTRSASAAIDGPLAWYTPLLEVLARNQTLRMSLLAIAAVVMVGAFTFLHETDDSAGNRSTSAGGGPIRRFINRYRKGERRKTPL
jgi:cell division protein FtsB